MQGVNQAGEFTLVGYYSNRKVFKETQFKQYSAMIQKPGKIYPSHWDRELG